jgi:hypothetical protein
MTGTGTLRWFRSSYSDDGGGNCVETAYTWHKSAYSDGGGGNCLEISPCPRTVHIRDSKVTDGPEITVSPASWAAFVGAAGAE